jgi:hypothetical protein
MPQCRRWLLVDGPSQARPAHGRPLPVEFCRASRRGFPAMESQRKPIDARRRKHIPAEQRAAGQASSAEGEDVQEALHRLCSCKRPEPGRRSTGNTAGRRVAELEWEPSDA